MGPKSALGLPRGVNRLWTKGGIMYAPRCADRPPDRRGRPGMKSRARLCSSRFAASVRARAPSLKPVPAPAPVRHFLRTRRGRALAYQALALGALVAAGWFLCTNTAENLAARQIRSGFGFLGQPAGFDIGETLFAYTSRDTYLRAFGIGVANTLRVALAGIALATVLARWSASAACRTTHSRAACARPSSRRCATYR